MNNKKKVAFIVLGSTYSGAEVVLNRYLEGNESIDPHFILIYRNEEVRNKFNSLYGQYKVYSLNLEYKQRNITFLPFIEKNKISSKLKIILDIIKPEILYLNNTTETMLLGDLGQDIPKIAHIHDMPSYSRSPIRLFYTRKGIKKCDKVLTVSKACADKWKMDMEVIYNGIDNRLFLYKETNKIYNIGFVGGLTKRKGIDVIIKSIDEIMRISRDIRVNFVFNSVEDESMLDLLKFAALKYENRIILYNNLEQKEMINLYDNMDLIIVPSRHDPLPTVVMESLSRGTLVIGSNIDGIPELLNYNQELMLDNLSSKALVSKIKEIIRFDNRKLNNLTSKLFSYSKTNFNSKDKMLRINCIIKDIIYKR